MKKNNNLKFAIIATDIVLFSYINNQLCVRLINCKNEEDFPKMKCLPGGLIGLKETSDIAAKRILKEKANINTEVEYLEQLKTYSRVDRDPRGRVLAIAYIGIINVEDISSDDILEFVSVKSIRKLAYDHNEILIDAINVLRHLIMTTNIIFKLTDDQFTVAELKVVWENLMDREADKRNFLKKLKLANALKDTKKKKRDGAFRPASIFTHTEKNVVKKAFF
jgi:8-oxo-dGTP diphosphatase